MSEASTCLYEVLELRPGADPAELERSYERLSQVFGPTSLAIYGLVDAEEQQRMLRRIEEAYRTLADPDARAAYDEARGYPRPNGMAAALRDEREPEAAPTAVLEEIEVTVVAPVATREPAPREEAPVEERSGSPSPAESPPVQSEMAFEEEAPPPLPPRPPMPNLDDETIYTGALLRTVREAKGITLQQIAARTRITATHLDNLENERYEWLPERVFLRGFLISYARELKLDPTRVAQTYLARRESSR